MSDTSIGALPPTRQINLPLDSRYGDTKLFQINDNDRRRGLTAGRKRIDQDRDLPPKLQNIVLKRVNTFVWGVWNPITFQKAADDIIHTVSEAEVGRLDLLASEFFGNPNFWWVIAHENNIKDPLKDVVAGLQLRIPSFEAVTSTALTSSTQTVRPFVPGVAT